MRTRQLLKKEDLEAFALFCETRGWEVRRNVGPREVLRMSHPRRDTMSVEESFHVKNHYPLHDEASRMFTEWEESKK